MAILPTKILEVEFDAGVWTDVTADLVELNTRRGRNRESGAYETGQMVFTLRNATRKYDPDNTAGPYYGKLRPNRRARFRATYSAVTYPVFQGYLDKITQVYGGPNDGTAEFQVSDIFKLLNRADLPESVYDAELASPAPLALWKLNEPAGATVAFDSVGTAHFTDVVNAPGFGAAGLVVRNPNSAMTLTTGVGGAYLHRTGDAMATGAPLSLELWYRHTPAAADGNLGGMLQPNLQNAASLSIATTEVVFLVSTGGVVITAATTGANITDGATHHIVAIWKATGALKIYVDGIDRTSGAPTTAPNLTFTSTTSWEYLVGGVGTASVGTYQYFAIYNTDIAAAVAGHNTAGRTPWNGDLPGTRLGRILDLAAVPAADRTIDAGTTVLQSASLETTALGYAQKIEETELGFLFIARDGKVRFIGREAAVTGAYLTSQATLVDDDSGAGIPYREGVSADVDEAFVVTRATVSRDGSVAVTFYDAAAKAEFGWLDETHDGLLHNSDTYSASYAQWVVSTHKTPASRVGTLTIEPPALPATMYPVALGLELADRVTYKRKPQNTGTVTTIDMRVESVSHETGAGYWRTRLQLSPFNLGQSGYPVGIWDGGLWDQSVWGI